MNRPQSATNGWVALSGVTCMLLGVAALNQWPPSCDIAFQALIVMGCAAVGILVPDLWVGKVQRRSLRDPAPRGDWPRTLTKAAGLAGAVGFIALLYCVFPEYYNGVGFYGHCLVAIRVVLPVWAVLTLPYLYWVDRRMAQPEDGLWHVGRVVLLQWQGIDAAKAGNHMLGWLVKGFFLPLMFTYLCKDLDKLLHYDLQRLHGVMGFYDWAYFVLYFIDVAMVAMTYTVSLRLSDTHIRSTEPTLLGWVTALVCYQPFWTLINHQYIAYEGPMLWDQVLRSVPLLKLLWACAILGLIGIYVWATISFGGRFSNLTHRGIITNGPYRFSKHPAYLAKCASWWLISMPFIASDGPLLAVRRCALLLLLNALYYLRAKTEERHLSADPVYVQYAAWIEAHGALRRLDRLPGIGAMARWRPLMQSCHRAANDGSLSGTLQQHGNARGVCRK
jgi:protein-S-isoprenylcysteine O-methyltransferase Ste14